MSDLVQLVQEADFAIFEVEQSRAAVEAAKLALEVAKEEFDKSKATFDQVIARADDIGVPRAKIKKLAEERSAALLASGLFSSPVNQPRIAKIPKAKKAAKTVSDESTEENRDEAFENENNVIQMDA